MQGSTSSFNSSFPHPVAITPEIIASLKVLGFDEIPRHGPSHSGSSSSSSPSSSSSSFPIRKSPLVRLPTPQEVRQRYRELAHTFHPDLSSGDSQRMKHINAAYELLQSSGVLLTCTGRRSATGHPNNSSNNREKGMEEEESGGVMGSFTRRGEGVGRNNKSHSSMMGTGEKQEKRNSFRRSAVHPDFAAGGDQSWALKSAFEWRSMIGNVDQLRPEELQNPANHPLSHSKFFSMEEDATIYQMLRGGATIVQVARTLCKPATFIEKRLHNVQFKLRVQYLLRAEKKRLQQEEAKKKNKKNKTSQMERGSAAASPSYSSTSAPLWGEEEAGGEGRGKEKRPWRRYKGDDDPRASSQWKLNQRSTSSRVHGPNMSLSALRPYAGGPCVGDSVEHLPRNISSSPPYSSFALRPSHEGGGGGKTCTPPRKNVWEPSISRWEEQTYYADLSLEEKAKYDHIIDKK